MRLSKYLYLSFVMAGSSKGGVFEQWELESEHRPRFGRNWWYWKPSLTNNGGNFKKNRNTDISFYWFCFVFSVTLFARTSFDT
jgi:hypothetical protein